MKKSLPKQKIREEASVVRVSPKEKKIFDLIDCEASKPDSVLNKNPYVVLKYFQEKWQCFSDWEKDELKQFTGFLQHFAQYTWEQVYKTGSKIPKHGLAYTKYDTAEIRSGAKAHLDRVKSQISEDINFFELRVNQEKLRVHGFQSQTGFFLVLLDREHSVFPM